MTTARTKKSEDGSKHHRVVDHLRSFITRQGLLAGDRLPPERELADLLKLTRGDVRRAVGYLAALGILEVRHGVGAFLADSTTALGSASLEMLQMGSGFNTAQMFEARRALECELVSLAAERSREDQLTPMAEALAEMFAATEDADEFLIHDIRFHRAIARASGNPILAALMEVIAGALYDERKQAAGTLTNRTAALELHKRIYRAIRARDPKKAREMMRSHLESAEQEG
jgi:GntR family transcriptional repressor for pyruvate dehydrogenase complex